MQEVIFCQYKYIVYGNWIGQDIDEVRKSLGLCQQFDVLFEDLTVEEHLSLVCNLKDIDIGRMQQDIDETVNVVMLNEHRHKLGK